MASDFFKKYVLAIFSFILMPLLLATSLDARSNDLQAKKIRKQLLAAVDSKKITDSLYSVLQTNPKSALNIAYIATLEALKAKHAWNPYTKLQWLSDSRKTFSKAVIEDAENIEIRFMRFSVQHNLPGFLGQSKNLDEDRLAIIAELEKKNYGSADPELIRTIIRFLMDSKRCTEAETERLKQQLSQL